GGRPRARGRRNGSARGRRDGARLVGRDPRVTLSRGSRGRRRTFAGTPPRRQVRREGAAVATAPTRLCGTRSETAGRRCGPRGRSHGRRPGRRAASVVTRPASGAGTPAARVR